MSSEDGGKSNELGNGKTVDPVTEEAKLTSSPGSPTTSSQPSNGSETASTEKGSEASSAMAPPSSAEHGSLARLFARLRTPATTLP